MAIGPQGTGTSPALGWAGPGLTAARARHNGPEEADCFARMSDVVRGGILGPSPSLSVIVVTRPNSGSLERCLRSILMCDYDDFEVIVVDTGPPSLDTPRMLVRQLPGELRLRYVAEPWAPASLARNIGLARAEAEIVAFIDDDVIVDRPWLRACVDAMLGGEIACVTGRCLPKESDSEMEPPVALDDQSGGSGRRTYRMSDRQKRSALLPNRIGPLGSRGGIVLLTEVARKLGGFDPALGPATLTCGGENIDLLLRLGRRGWAVAHEPSAVVWREHAAGGGRPRRHAIGQGIGFGAAIAKQVLVGPKRRELVRIVPGAVRDLSRPDPGQRVGQSSSHPRHLVWLTRLGMLAGPVVYLLSALITLVRRLTSKRRSEPRPLRIVRRIVVGGEPVNIVWFREVQGPRLRFAWRASADLDGRGPSREPVMVSEPAIARPATSAAGPLRISAVVPARNAEAWIESCLRAIRANRPAEVILVDGGSTDRTVELARPWVDKVIDDGGAGVAAARMMGVVSASQPWIALVDADVVLPPNALHELDRERSERRLVALQAGLHSVGTGDYWSQSLANHHNHGKSKGWFGVCASLIPRDLLMAHPLDAHLRSGEDIDLRIRLTRAGFRIGVSEAMVTEHRFANGFTFAGKQWLADGAGLGRMVRKHGSAALGSAMMPFAAAGLGILRGMRDALRPWPYFAGFAIGNYVGLWRGLVDRSVPARGLGRWLPVAGMLVLLLTLPALLAATSTVLAFLMIRLGHAAYEGRLLPVTLGILAVAIPFEVARGGGSGRFSTIAQHVAPFAAWAVLFGLALSGLRLARVVGL